VNLPWLAYCLSKWRPEQIVMQHSGFITMTFLVTGTVLAGMIAAVLIDYRVQRRTLRRLRLGHSDPRGRV
jgi:heme exporter protein CcmD